MVGVDHIVRKIDEQLSQATFRGRVVAEHGGKGSIAQRFGETLAESLPSSRIVAQTTPLELAGTVTRVGRGWWLARRGRLTEGSSGRRA